MEPRWSAAGPRLDALPEANARAAQQATELEVGILLTGDGADELLGVPRFATAAVTAQHGPAAALRYLRDVARSGPGLLGELAVSFPLAPGRVPTLQRADHGLRPMPTIRSTHTTRFVPLARFLPNRRSWHRGSSPQHWECRWVGGSTLHCPLPISAARHWWSTCSHRTSGPRCPKRSSTFPQP
jgi:hypothetical protein